MGPIWGEYGALYGANMGFPSGPQLYVSVGETWGLYGIEYGLEMGPIWGQCVTNNAFVMLTWVLYGSYMGTMWVLYGPHMGPVWCFCGIHMGSRWGIYGISMGVIWDSHVFYGQHKGRVMSARELNIHLQSEVKTAIVYLVHSSPIIMAAIVTVAV